MSSRETAGIQYRKDGAGLIPRGKHKKRNYRDLFLTISRSRIIIILATTPNPTFTPRNGGPTLIIKLRLGGGINSALAKSYSCTLLAKKV